MTWPSPAGKNQSWKGANCHLPLILLPQEQHNEYAGGTAADGPRCEALRRNRVNQPPINLGSGVSFFRVCDDAVNMAVYATRWLLRMKRRSCSGTVKVIMK